jgi:hypothetical protein
MHRHLSGVMMALIFGVGISAIQAISTDQVALAHEGEEHAIKTTLRHPKAEELGKTETCAVKGTKFQVAGDTPVIDYQGKTFYFCDDDTLDAFQDDPDKYAK